MKPDLTQDGSLPAKLPFKIRLQKKSWRQTTAKAKISRVNVKPGGRRRLHFRTKVQTKIKHVEAIQTPDSRGRSSAHEVG